MSEQTKNAKRRRVAQPTDLMPDTTGKMPRSCRTCLFENNCIRHRMPRGQASCRLVSWVYSRFARAGASPGAGD
jgi:hypothetical protein